MTEAGITVPEGWASSRLGEVLSTVKDKVDPADAPDARYVGLEHVEARSMRLLGHGRASDVTSKKTRFDAGDVLYGKLRPYLNKVARPDFAGLCSTDFLVFAESEAVDAGFLAQYLNQSWVADRAHQLSAGIERPRIEWKTLSQFPIAYPPSKVEQRAIVDQLERIGRLRSKTDSCLTTAHAKVVRLREAIIGAACSGQLTADWREANSVTKSATMLVERSKHLVEVRSPRRSTARPVAEPDRLMLPESWTWSPLRDLAEIRGGIQKRPKRVPKSNAYPYLRVANVLRGRLSLSEVHRFELFDGELETYRLKPGDLLVVEGNGSANEIGRCALWSGEIADCVHQNHIIRARFVEMLPRFVELYWNSPVGSREIASLAVTSAGLYSLTSGKIGSIRVPVAPLEEQREVVRRADRLLGILDSSAASVENAARRVKWSSQAILGKAFRGELAGASSWATLATTG